jgi:hypothetical protein
MEITAYTIMNRIASVHKNKELDKEEIHEWCAQALKNIAEADLMVPYVDAILNVVNGIAVLPCTVFRLQNVKPCHSTGVIYYRRTGQVLRFDQHHVTNMYASNPDPSLVPLIKPEVPVTSTVLIDFLGLPMNAEGEISIPDPASEACYWYCLGKTFEEDYFMNRLSGEKWHEIQANYGTYVTKAKQSMVMTPNQKLDKINRIVYNQKLSIRSPETMY